MSIDWGRSQSHAGRAGRGTVPAHGCSSIPCGQRAAPGPETSGSKECGKCPPVPAPENLSGVSSIFGKEMGEQSWTAGKCSPAQCPGVWEGGGWIQGSKVSVHRQNYSNTPSPGRGRVAGGREHSAGSARCRRAARLRPPGAALGCDADVWAWLSAPTSEI